MPEGLSRTVDSQSARSNPSLRLSKSDRSPVGQPRWSLQPARPETVLGVLRCRVGADTKPSDLKPLVANPNAVAFAGITWFVFFAWSRSTQPAASEIKGVLGLAAA